MVAAKSTVKSCLELLEVNLDGCVTLEDEFKVIKRAYHKKALVTHPDKGGSGEAFRLLNTAFESLKELFENKSILSFKNATDKPVDGFNERFGQNQQTKSWDYYYAAAEEPVPLYRVEIAKSNRSRCAQTKSKSSNHVSEFINKNELRFGSINPESGRYGKWTHVECWKVPQKIWQGLPDPNKCQDRKKFAEAIASMNEVLICGFNELNENQKEIIVSHIMNEANHAGKKTTGKIWSSTTQPNVAQPATTKKQKKNETTTSSLKRIKIDLDARENIPVNSSSSSSSLISVKKKQTNNMLVPQNESQASFLKGKTVVMTGTFPEIGGGMGLELGKERLRSMLQSLGAKGIFKEF